MREELLVLVISGAWLSSNERRVIKYESNKSVKMEGGLVLFTFLYLNTLVCQIIIITYLL